MGRAEIRASGRTPIEDAINRRTTQYLILQTLNHRVSTFKSLERQVKVKVNRIKKEDKEFCFFLPSVPDCFSLNMRAVVSFWIRQGIIEEKIPSKMKKKSRKIKTVLRLTPKGFRSFEYLVRNSNGVGLNPMVKKLFPVCK